jgi:predicted RNase H-like nuclease (RuvC/YqgF family)
VGFLTAPSVQAAFVSGVLAIIGTYLTIQWQRSRVRRVDPTEYLFKEYREFIKKSQEEGARKDAIIANLEATIARQEQELEHNKSILSELKEEVRHTKSLNRELESKLTEMSVLLKHNRDNGILGS